MIGKAASMGAATIVNAIGCGKGAAFGISLEVDAHLTLERGQGQVGLEGSSEGAGLVQGCVRSAASEAGFGPVEGVVRVVSGIPISRGLKSSSAVSNAVVLGTLRAIGAEIEDMRLLNIAIDESIREGVTVTGAFDDAAACYFGGLVLTDNISRSILKRDNLDPELTVIVHVPTSRLSKSAVDKSRFADNRDRFREAFDLAAKGEYSRAMALNSRTTARSLDLSDEAAEAAMKAGAQAAGITGTGPATVALCRRDRSDDVERAMSAFEGSVIRTALNTTPSREVIPRLL